LQSQKAFFEKNLFLKAKAKERQAKLRGVSRAYCTTVELFGALELINFKFKFHIPISNYLLRKGDQQAIAFGVAGRNESPSATL